MQRIFAPFAAASAISFKCFSIASRLIFSRGSSVAVAQVAWMRAQRTIRGIYIFLSTFKRLEKSQYKAKPNANVTNQAYVYKVSKRPGMATCPPGVVAARRNPGTTGAIATTKATIARQFVPFEYE